MLKSSFSQIQISYSNYILCSKFSFLYPDHKLSIALLLAQYQHNILHSDLKISKELYLALSSLQNSLSERKAREEDFILLLPLQFSVCSAFREFNRSMIVRAGCKLVMVHTYCMKKRNDEAGSKDISHCWPRSPTLG